MGQVLTEGNAVGQWRPEISMIGLLFLLHNLLIVGRGRLDDEWANIDYQPKEAQSAFRRVASFHGWT